MAVNRDHEEDQYTSHMLTEPESILLISGQNSKTENI